MRPNFLVSGLLLFSLPACTMSELDPNAQVDLFGSAQFDSGELIANQKVALVKTPDLGEVLGGLILAPVTVLACLGEEPPPLCQEARIERSNSAGTFHFSLLGRDTQGSIGNASEFSVTTSLPASPGEVAGPSSSQRFQIQSEEMYLPGLELWQTDMAFNASADSLQVLVDQSDSTPVALRFESAGPWSAPIWEVENYQGEELDARIFEDRSMNLVALRERETFTEGSRVISTERSASHSLVGLAGAAPSRFASCFVSASDNSLVELDPCALSDGDMTSPYPTVGDPDCHDEDEGACEPSMADRVALLDLGVSVPADLLVLRLGYDDAQIEYSEDGQSWTGLGVPRHGPTVIELPVNTSLRYLRIRAVGPQATLAGLSELSLW